MYEDIFTNIDQSAINKVIYALNNNAVFYLDFPKLITSGTNAGRYSVSGVGISVGSKLTLTGRYFTTDNDMFIQAVLNENNQSGYIVRSEAENYTDEQLPENVAKAQNIFDELITYHQDILENNLLCARAIELMNEKGATVPNDYKKRLYDLQNNLVARNNQIKNSGYITEAEEAASPNFSVYNKALVTFMNNPGIGLAPVVIYIIVLGVVALGSALAAYGLFKKLHTSAKIDMKYSDNLTADLVRYLPEEVYTELMAENKANVKQWQKAVNAAGSRGWLSVLKYGAIGFGSIYLIDKFIIKKG